jgi:hypothetical protein
MAETPEQLRRRADMLESRRCTGLAAAWCPVHGDCTCFIGENGEQIEDDRDGLNSEDCPLHSIRSSHGEAWLQGRAL